MRTSYLENQLKEHRLENLDLEGNDMTVIMCNGERFHHLSFVGDDGDFTTWLMSVNRSSKMKVILNSRRIEAILK